MALFRAVGQDVVDDIIERATWSVSDEMVRVGEVGYAPLHVFEARTIPDVVGTNRISEHEPARARRRCARSTIVTSTPLAHDRVELLIMACSVSDMRLNSSAWPDPTG
jgi:hypothetical protein